MPTHLYASLRLAVADRHSPLRLHLVTVVVSALAALLLCLAITVRWTTWVLRPVRRIDAVARQFVAGRLDARVPVDTGPPDLRRLSRRFNEIAETVQDTVVAQRVLVANASHQLRNPLNALLLRIDDLVLSLPPELSQRAELAAADARHLSHVLDELLVYAQARVDTVGQVTGFDLARVVQERVDQVGAAAEAKGQRLVVRGTASLARGDRLAVAGALDIVLENAVKFSPDDAEIEVRLGSTTTTREVSVRDSGEALSDGDLELIGSPFWRSHRHRNVPGTGLGLSIARALLRPSGARLLFARGPGGSGLLVTIELPTRARRPEA